MFGPIPSKGIVLGRRISQIHAFISQHILVAARASGNKIVEQKKKDNMHSQRIQSQILAACQV